MSDRPIHMLKTEPQYYRQTLDGKKMFEIRLNDRGFAVGDTVILAEYDAALSAYTDSRLTMVITYITGFNQRPGYVVFGMNRFL